MQLARSLPATDWRWVAVRTAIVAFVAVNAILTIDRAITVPIGADFDRLARATMFANPYDEPYYVWSPVAVYLLELLIPLGLHGWAVLHALALVPLGWPLVGIVAVSHPLWEELLTGHVMLFIAVAAFTGVRGNRIGALLFFAMAALMPRPIMLPVLAWLLWKQPWSRWPFVTIMAAHGGLVLWTGLADEWIARMMDLPDGMAHPGNPLPSHWIGYWWVPIGWTLAAWLTLRGRLGLASLMASPYLYPGYFLMLVLDWPMARPPRNPKQG